MFLIVLLSIGAVSATDPLPCCAPSPYSGVLLQVGGINPQGTEDVTFTDQVLEIQYDWDNKKIAIVNHMMNMTTFQRYTSTVRTDYAAGETYISTEDGHCYKQAITATLQSHCIPANFTFLGTTTIGDGMNGIRVNRFDGNTDNGRMSLSVTADGECIPVSMTVFAADGHERSVNAYLFTNIQKSINPAMFNVPDDCKNHAITIPPNKRALEDALGADYPF